MPGLRRVNRALAKISSPDRGDALERIGALVESQTKKRIADGKKSPDGKPWKSWSTGYAKTRRAGQSLLHATGHLLQSIQYEANDEIVLVGSNLKYARTHQVGDQTRGIPARPYIGVSAEDGREIVSVLDRWYRTHVGPLFAGVA